MTHGAATPAVTLAMHDGFYSCGSGAGRSNRAFLETLTTMVRPSVRLALLPIYLSTASSEYNPAWHAAMRALVRRTGAEVIPISNGSDGQVRFGGLANFRAACAAAANMISHHLLPTAAPLLVIAFDAPFYGLPAHLASHVRGDVVVVARSTAALHAPGDLAHIAWERDSLQTTAAAGGRIAAISGHMRRHLATSYGIPSSALINLPNGLTRADWQTGPPDTSLLPAPARRGFRLQPRHGPRGALQGL
ncbi:MAG TPA: hypothetical protein VLW50_23520 [Streptosporangiaceae bacterium]|nr:hypothetical protein [Streptosporangiaceae bacterium]